nr:hypothetical protein [uncultured Fretibacterium sp.]
MNKKRKKERPRSTIQKLNFCLNVLLKTITIIQSIQAVVTGFVRFWVWMKKFLGL